MTVYYALPSDATPAWPGEPTRSAAEKETDILPPHAGPETVKHSLFTDAEPYDPGLLELARWRLGKLREAWIP